VALDATLWKKRAELAQLRAEVAEAKRVAREFRAGVEVIKAQLDTKPPSVPRGRRDFAAPEGPEAELGTIYEEIKVRGEEAASLGREIANRRAERDLLLAEIGQLNAELAQKEMP